MKKILFAGAVCCLLAGLLSSCATIDAIFKDREELSGEKRLDDKGDLSEPQPDLTPEYAEPKEYDEFGRAVSRTSTESLNLVKHGKEWLAAGDNIAAIDDFTKAISIDRRLADAYYYRGLAYDNVGDYERAARDFSVTTTINPEYVKAYFGRAEAYLNSGNINGAIDDFGIACEKGYTAACVEREKLTGSLGGPGFNDEKVMP